MMTRGRQQQHAGDNNNTCKSMMTHGRQRQHMEDMWETTTMRRGCVVRDCRGMGHVWETLREHMAGLGLVCGKTSCG